LRFYALIYDAILHVSRGRTRWPVKCPEERKGGGIYAMQALTMPERELEKLVRELQPSPSPQQAEKSLPVWVLSLVKCVATA